MFDFIHNTTPEDAIAGVHFALRRLSYRNPDATASTTHLVATEPVTTDERIGLKILNEIVDKEQSPIESLTETKAQKYKDKLLDIADELSEKDVVADDETKKVLEQWDIPLLDVFRPLSRAGALMLTAYFISLTLAFLFMLFALWPRWDVTGQYWSNSANILGTYLLLDLEMRLILIAAIAGGVGSILHALRSLVFFIGNRTLASSWVSWYLIQPLTGMLAAVISYFVLRATPLFGSPPQTSREFYLIASVSILVGMFSDKAGLKLSEVFDTVFRSKSSFDLKRDERSSNTVIASVEPATGPDKGGTVVIITGRFTGSNNVLFGGVAASSVQLINSKTLVVTTPPHPDGVVDLTVVNDNGQALTQRGAFQYTSKSVMSWDSFPFEQKENAKDVLLSFLKEYYARLQHYETQRSTVSNLLVVVAAAILAFVTFDRALTIADLPLTVLLVFIGLFGAGFCMKYYERSARQMDRIEKIRNKIDEVLFDSLLIRHVNAEAAKQHAQEFPQFETGGRLSWMKVSRLWIIFHLCLALIGLILSILIYFI